MPSFSHTRQCVHLSEPPEETDSSAASSEYHDLKQVFSNDKALSLPPHRPYDCAIDLLPGSPLPSKKLYNLSKPKKEAMDAYIQDSLSTGLIRPSSSSLGAGSFFVEKKDRSLRPCIDYTGLKEVTIKNGRSGRSIPYHLLTQHSLPSMTLCFLPNWT